VEEGLSSHHIDGRLIRVLTEVEKTDLAGALFRNVNLDCVDFVGADLRRARFENVSLIGCDFSRADLRGTEFYDCDLRGSRFSSVNWGNNVFLGSAFSRSSEIGKAQTQEIESSGGSFLPTGALPSRR
jgi:uncharacterized protein YjbI with pentapeptide repeats